MAKFSTKHKDREKTFSIRTFSDGLNLEVSPSFLPVTALTKCMNMKYAIEKRATSTVLESSNLVVLKKRQGTEVISASALPSSADVMACTYYVAGAKYILATASKLYYLDASYDPVEIGSISGVPTFTEFHGKLIIHDSGTTKAWNGTTFETLNCLYENEAIETGNNSDVDFTGTLSHAPIKPGSLTINYTDTTTKTITDDGAGNLTGDVASDTNTINYTTGDYAFRCSGAPDNTTTVYAAYEKVNGAPKSKGGIVRGSRLYMWGDSDYPSRLWYSGPSDEDAWDTSSGGGYEDVDPLDGFSITGVIDFVDYLVVIKGNSLHLLKSYPGESDFGVYPLLKGLGGVSHRACLNLGGLIAFLTKEGFTGFESTNEYGDIKKAKDLSAPFQSQAVRYANSSAYCEYNQTDKQIWLTLYDDVNSAYVPTIFVINLETGGQFSQYRFAFAHSCYKYVNGEMLIGGTDGKLYRLLKRDSRFKDNGVSYASDTYCRGVMANFGMPVNRKHNKLIYPNLYGKMGMTATLNLYKDGDYDTAFDTMTVTVPLGSTTIAEYADTLIYDADDVPIGAERIDTIRRKFNYHDVMFELTSITGALGAEMYGIDFTSAIIGD